MALLLAVVAACALSSAPGASGAALGVFRGGGNVGAVQQFASWLGAQPTHVLEFFARQTWSDISTPTWFLQRWQPTSYELEFSVAMLPETGSWTLEAGAQGAYDQHFVTLAQNLVAHGFGDSIIRLGWEFNGTWYVWAAAQNPTAWRDYWRRIVTAMRSVPGAAFRFDWCPILGGNLPLEQVYPGDEYVDYIGLDVYDVDFLPGREDPATRWSHLVHMPYGLLWHRQFAAAHGKPMTFPEWGVWDTASHPGAFGDNPYFIDRMYEWVHQAGVEYQMYFEFHAHDGDHELEGPTQFPQSAVRFRELFRTIPATVTVPPIPPNVLAPPPAPEPPPPPVPAKDEPHEQPPPPPPGEPAPVGHERADGPADESGLAPDGDDAAADDESSRATDPALDLDLTVAGVPTGGIVSTRPAVTAELAGAAPVRHVAFYVNRKKVCHVVAAPYRCRPRLRVGSHLLAVVATTRSGDVVARELTVRATQRLRAPGAARRVLAHAA